MRQTDTRKRADGHMSTESRAKKRKTTAPRSKRTPLTDETKTRATPEASCMRRLPWSTTRVFPMPSSPSTAGKPTSGLRTPSRPATRSPSPILVGRQPPWRSPLYGWLACCGTAVLTDLLGCTAKTLICPSLSAIAASMRTISCAPARGACKTWTCTKSVGIRPSWLSIPQLRA